MLDEWNATYIKCNGEKVKLTWNELYVLEYMIEHKKKISTPRELVEAVYGKGTFYKKRSCLNSFIRRIRIKLAGEIEIINCQTIGYKIKYIGE